MIDEPITPRIGGVSLTRRNAAILVAVVALAIYASSLFNLFAYDDVAVIRDDARVHALTLKSIHTIFVTNYWNNQAQAIYRPLVTTSFAADWAVAHNHPGWFHFTNILWNAATCVLIFLILCELFPVTAALGGALLFAVHPVHVEAVANVVGRAELMAATFAMGAALIWMRSPREQRYSVRMLVACPLLFFLAMLCKESAIMLPALLVLLDIGTGTLTRHTIREWIAQRALPVVALAVPAIVFLVMRGSVLHAFGPTNLDAALEVAPHGMPRILTSFQIWPQFLRLFVFPRILLADYGPRILMPQTSVTPMVAFGFLLLAAQVVGGCIAAWRGYGRTALALLWIPVAMLPVSNLLFPIGIILAERTLYLPLFAVSIGAAAYFANMERTPGTARQAWGALLIVCAAMTARTLVRIPDWHNTSSIFRALTRSRPDAFRAQWHLARVASDEKNPVKAMQYYSAAMQLWPYRSRLLKEASDYAAHHGELEFAKRIAEQGISVYPDDPDFRRSLAGVSLDMGDTAQAIAQIKRGLELAPNDRVLHDMQKALKKVGK